MHVRHQHNPARSKAVISPTAASTCGMEGLSRCSHPDYRYLTAVSSLVSLGAGRPRTPPSLSSPRYFILGLRTRGTGAG